jgi:hypothetical protein
MQISIGEIIQAGTLLVVILAHFIRSESNQKEIMRRLDNVNGNIKDLDDWRMHHVETCHTEQKR